MAATTTMVQDMIEAMNAGEEYVKNLQVGQRFDGSRNEAIRRGYEHGSTLYNMFAEGAHQQFKRHDIYVDAGTGKITRIDRR